MVEKILLRTLNFIFLVRENKPWTPNYCALWPTIHFKQNFNVHHLIHLKLVKVKFPWLLNIFRVRFGTSDSKERGLTRTCIRSLTCIEKQISGKWKQLLLMCTKSMPIFFQNLCLLSIMHVLHSYVVFKLILSFRY